MEKYIKNGMQFVMFTIVALIGIALINSVVQNKLTKLADLDASGVSTISEFKAEIKDKDRRLQCMAQNIYWEAASEPAEGKVAVAQVVMNRVESGRFPETHVKWYTKKM